MRIFTSFIYLSRFIPHETRFMSQISRFIPHETRFMSQISRFIPHETRFIIARNSFYSILTI